jgi:competence protein ComEC
VVRVPSGATLLYDAGSLTSPDWAANAISSCLWFQGIVHLDAVLLSHADADHYNALPALLERFSIGVVCVPPTMFDREEPALTALHDALRKANVPVRETFAGDRLSGGQGCSIEVLHPPRRGVLGSDNANSLVVTIEYEGKRILLPGDLERPGLDDVLAEEPLPCDVLLAPHHGSRGSDPPGLAHWCTPRFVVVSGSLSSNVAQTTATYRDMGAEVLHTAEHGAVTVRLDDRGVQAATWLRARK